jgi:hypothetical protein
MTAITIAAVGDLGERVKVMYTKEHRKLKSTVKINRKKRRRFKVKKRLAKANKIV